MPNRYRVESIERAQFLNRKLEFGKVPFPIFRSVLYNPTALVTMSVLAAKAVKGQPLPVADIPKYLLTLPYLSFSEIETRITNNTFNLEEITGIANTKSPDFEMVADQASRAIIKWQEYHIAHVFVDSNQSTGKANMLYLDPNAIEYMHQLTGRVTSVLSSPDAAMSASVLADIVGRKPGERYSSTWSLLSSLVDRHATEDAPLHISDLTDSGSPSVNVARKALQELCRALSREHRITYTGNERYQSYSLFSVEESNPPVDLHSLSSDATVAAYNLLSRTKGVKYSVKEIIDLLGKEGIKVSNPVIVRHALERLAERGSITHSRSKIRSAEGNEAEIYLTEQQNGLLSPVIKAINHLAEPIGIAYSPVEEVLENPLRTQVILENTLTRDAPKEDYVRQTLSLVKQNPHISSGELTSRLHKDLATVMSYLSDLERAGEVTRSREGNVDYFSTKIPLNAVELIEALAQGKFAGAIRYDYNPLKREGERENNFSAILFPTIEHLENHMLSLDPNFLPMTIRGNVKGLLSGLSQSPAASIEWRNPGTTITTKMLFFNGKSTMTGLLERTLGQMLKNYYDTEETPKNERKTVAQILDRVQGKK